MTPEWLAMWLSAFVDTIIVETPIYMLLLGPTLGYGKAAFVSLGLQMATHPVLWLVWPEVSPHVDYVPLVVIAELIVVAVEAALIALVLGPSPGGVVARWTTALLAALTANVVSTAVGLLDGAVPWLGKGIFFGGLAVVVVTLVVRARRRHEP